MAATIEEVRRVMRNFRRRWRRLNWIVQSNYDEKESHDASLKVIKILTERNLKLREMGWWLGADGTPELITPELIRRERKKQTRIDKLQREVRDSGDPQKILEFIRELAKDEG